MVSDDGPLFVWRDGSKAYSERDGLVYTSGMFGQLCSSRPVLQAILARSDEVTADELNRPLRSRLNIAVGLARRCYGPVFLKILETLEERADVDGVTRADEAELIGHLKAALTHPMRFEAETGGGLVTMSVLAFAESQYVGAEKWTRIASFAAWAKAGPRIAIRGDFLWQYLGTRPSGFKSRSAGMKLRDRGVITMDERIDAYTRVWMVREDWLASEFDLTISAPEDGHPQLAAADVRAGDAGDKDVPF